MLDAETRPPDRDDWDHPGPGGSAAEPARVAIRRHGRPSAAGGELARFTAAGDAATALSAWCGRELLDALRPHGAAGLRDVLARDIAELDGRISRQLDAILSHPDLQKLEAVWRGVAYLLEAAGDDTRVRIRLLPVKWPEIAKDFEKALEFDQSAMFAKIYNDEFGIAGGTPYGLLLCDHAVRHKRDASYQVDDVSALAGLSQVAAAAFAPCLVGAAPQLLGVESFADLAVVQDVTSIFRSVEYGRWQNLQRRDDSRFLGVVLPSILLRPAWGDDGAREDGFRFREGRHGLDTGTWLWGSGVYALGAVAIRAFRDWGWFADIRGTRVDLQEAGLVDGLPSPSFSTEEPTAYRRPIAVEFTDRKQRALEEHGFIALSPCRLTPFLAVLSAPSIRVPEGATSAIVDANERLSTMLPYVLCASRFAHYVKVIARDRVGSYQTSSELEEMLRRWLSQYTMGNPDAGFEVKARYPLSGGRVEVHEIAGQPGSFGCTMHLAPHFQIDQVVAAFRFQTEIRASRLS